MEACWAHNPEVRRSKLRSANFFVFCFCFFLTLKTEIEQFSQDYLILSGWPSGLRRQTQGILPCSHDRGLYRDFWSSYEGVGSNPTSDSKLFFLILLLEKVEN